MYCPRACRLFILFTAVNGGWSARSFAEDTKRDVREPQTRSFKFYYHASIADLSPGARARVWIPLAANNAEQSIEVNRIKVPAESQQTEEQRFGNSVLYFEAEADRSGAIPIEIDYVVRRKEVLPATGERVDRDRLQDFLAAERLVPVSGELTSRLFGQAKPMGTSQQVALELYERVFDHMAYSKQGEGWGRGDARWACDSRYGNCTDFHSLFIGMCRDLKIPAKFEIGFPLPPNKREGTIDGYHCWAKYADNSRWVAVDISEADKNPEMKKYYFGSLTPDRVMLSTGRDLQLDPKPAAGPVNFLVYPYVEVDGKPHSGLKKAFRFENL